MNNSEKNEKKDDSVNIDINENVPLTNAEWSSQYEQILVEWADKAICYRWLHSTSQINYAFKNRWFTIPVIIMSTLTGTANFAQERIPEEYVAYYSVAVGSISILAGIITTIQQFLKISELNESHKLSSVSWDKLFRNIKVELDLRNEKIGYKIREHSNAKIPIILIIGEKEKENKSVAVRKLGSNKVESYLLKDFIDLIYNESLNK